MGKPNGRRKFFKNLFSLSSFIAVSALSLNKGKEFKIGKLSPTESHSMESSGKKVKKIAVEEHFYTKEYFSWLGSRTEFKGRDAEDSSVKKVLNLGEGRISDMDENGIDMQVLSLSVPSLDPFSTSDAVAMAKSTNDELSEVIKQYPKRFAGFAAIPLQDPASAADELERAVTKLGLKGTLIDCGVQAVSANRWISDDKYEVLLERAAILDAPIYLHQGGPSLEESGLRVLPDVLRLVSKGLFDKYPGLNFILGHGGESLPFWLWRRSGGVARSEKMNFSQAFKEHFYVTTSDQCSDILLQFLIGALGSDRIMFATDYPYESTKKHVDFIDSAPISDSDREKICHLNAERLFKL